MSNVCFFVISLVGQLEFDFITDRMVTTTKNECERIFMAMMIIESMTNASLIYLAYIFFCLIKRVDALKITNDNNKYVRYNQYKYMIKWLVECRIFFSRYFFFLLVY